MHTISAASVLSIENKDLVKYGSKVQLNDSDEEDEVYPLSIKYNARRALNIAIFRYIILLVLILFLIPADIYTVGESRKTGYRLGFFADFVTKKTFSIAEDKEFIFNVKNCNLIFKENTSTEDEIKLYVSSNRDADIEITTEGSVETVKLSSNSELPLCYAEIKVPGGVRIKKMTFNLEGRDLDNFLIKDYKADSTWNTPMNISTLEFSIDDSYPVIKMRHEHDISQLKITGSYCM